LNKKSPWDIFREEFLNGRKSFFDILSSYENERISDETIKKLEVLFKKPTLDLDYISRKSTAFSKLCEYIIRMVEYQKLLKGKKPKDIALKNVQVGLEKAQNKLKLLNENINRLEIEASFVINKLKEANEKKSLAQLDADSTLTAINLANRLIIGMKTEHSRWSDKLEILNNQKRNISTDYLLPVQFLTYAGAFTSKYRIELVNRCLDSLSKIFTVNIF
jgi:dynein heavy chain